MDTQEQFENQLHLVLTGSSQNVKSISEILHSGGVDVNSSNNDDTTPLQIAAAFGHVGILSLLIANSALVDEPNSLGWTPLMQATRNGHLSCMQKLIASGANILLKTKLGVDILSLAAASGSHDAVRCIIKNGASNASSLPSLCFAVLANDPNLVDIMLNFCNPNHALNFSGITPLMLATMIGNKHMVALLCSSRLNVASRNTLGQTASDIAIALHGLHFKHFNGSVLNQCNSSKFHMIQQINNYVNVIEIIEKSDPCSDKIVDSDVKKETNIKKSYENKCLNVSCIASWIAESIWKQKIHASKLTTGSNTSCHKDSQFSDRLQSSSYSLSYIGIQEMPDSWGNFTKNPSAILSNSQKNKQFENVTEQNVMKDILEGRSSPRINSFVVKNESCCSPSTKQLNPMGNKGKQSPLCNSVQGTPTLNQHIYPELSKNAETNPNPVLNISQRSASPRNSAKKGLSFRSPSKHIPCKGSGNRSPLASISRRIF